MAAPKNTYPSGKASLTPPLPPRGTFVGQKTQLPAFPPVRGVLQAVLFFNRKRRRARQEA
jgi:hypothetical protein